MRWKLLRRRLSISAPRVIVRSHLPWPLRWAAVAVVLGFSAAAALWAFEFGKDIAGLDRASKDELARLRAEVQQLRADSERAQSIASEQEVVRLAEQQAADMIDKARAQEREIRLGAEDYADEMLANLEVNLGKLLTAVQRGRDRLQGKVSQRQ